MRLSYSPRHGVSGSPRVPEFVSTAIRSVRRAVFVMTAAALGHGQAEAAPFDFARKPVYSDIPNYDPQVVEPSVLRQFCPAEDGSQASLEAMSAASERLEAALKEAHDLPMRDKDWDETISRVLPGVMRQLQERRKDLQARLQALGEAEYSEPSDLEDGLTAKFESISQKIDYVEALIGLYYSGSAHADVVHKSSQLRRRIHLREKAEMAIILKALLDLGEGVDCDVLLIRHLTESASKAFPDKETPLEGFETPQMRRLAEFLRPYRERYKVMWDREKKVSAFLDKIQGNDALKTEHADLLARFSDDFVGVSYPAFDNRIRTLATSLGLSHSAYGGLLDALEVRLSLMTSVAASGPADERVAEIIATFDRLNIDAYLAKAEADHAERFGLAQRAVAGYDSLRHLSYLLDDSEADGGGHKVHQLDTAHEEKDTVYVGLKDRLSQLLGRIRLMDPKN